MEEPEFELSSLTFCDTNELWFKENFLMSMNLQWLVYHLNRLLFPANYNVVLHLKIKIRLSRAILLLVKEVELEFSIDWCPKP